jgi:polyisoprenoid-binding protein YceI
MISIIHRQGDYHAAPLNGHLSFGRFKNTNTMKPLKILLPPFMLIALLSPTAHAQEAIQLKSYSLKVQGTSTLHDWESSVEQLDCKGSFTMSKNSLSEIKNVVINIPVTSIKSPKGKLMDNKTYDAFHFEKYPRITFSMTGCKIQEDKGVLIAAGTLSMAGVSRPTELTMNYKVLPNGELRITGSKKIAMSNFKMEPPTAMMGTVKVGDEVVVTFDLTITQGTALTKQNK